MRDDSPHINNIAEKQIITKKQTNKDNMNLIITVNQIPNLMLSFCL